MARLPRLVIPQALHHVIQRSHDGVALFRDVEDHQRFIGWLAEGGKLFQVQVHAYVLMPDHVHLLMTPVDDTGLGKMMQWVGRHYVPYFNRKYQRSGSLWQGRFKATVIEGERYFLPCSIYIESNPVRARLVQEAEDYPWSSYRHHIGLQTDPLIADHSLYWALGNTPFQREAAYKERMAQSFADADIDAMMKATLKGWMLGSAQFKAEMAKLTERRIEPVRRGRPRKA